MGSTDTGIFVAKLGEYRSHLAARHENYQDMYELGRRGVYHRSVQFPVECSLDITFSGGKLHYVAFNVAAEAIAALNAEPWPLRVPWLFAGKKQCLFAHPAGVPRARLRFNYERTLRDGVHVARFCLTRMEW